MTEKPRRVDEIDTENESVSERGVGGKPTFILIVNEWQLIATDRTAVSGERHRVHTSQRGTFMLMADDRAENAVAMVTFTDLRREEGVTGT